MHTVALEDQNKPNWLEATALFFQGLCLQEPRPDCVLLPQFAKPKSSTLQCSRSLFIPARARENSYTWIWFSPGLLLFAQSGWIPSVFRIRGLKWSLMTGLTICCSKSWNSISLHLTSKVFMNDMQQNLPQGGPEGPANISCLIGVTFVIFIYFYMYF